MNAGDGFEQYRDDLKPALKSKQEEFLLLGYDNVSEDDIWEFLKKKKWQKAGEPLKLYVMVQDILSLKIGEYMHFVSMEALKEADLSYLNEEDMMELLK